MKTHSFLLPLLSVLHFIASAQAPIFSLDANKGLNGTMWQDQSGMNNHITLSHATNVDQDGVYFDGANDAMLNTPIALGNFTVYITVKMEELGKTLLGDGNPSRYGFHYPDNVIYTAIDPEFSFFNSNAIVTNQQIVLTLTRSNGNIALFMNGNIVNTFPDNRTSTFTLTNLMGESGYQFKGWMKSMSVYNVTHDAARIKNTALATTSTTKIIPATNVNPNKAINASFIEMQLQLPFSNQIKTYKVKKYGEDYILNGDIIVSKRSLTGLLKPIVRIVGRTDNWFEGFKWKNGEIPVVIDANIAGMGLQDVVHDALEELNNKTALCYRPKTNGDDDYVRIIFVSDLGFQGGSSYVGRDGGEQKLKLNLPAGRGKFTIVHELLHAAGFYHEQSREDRGNYVRILEDNITDDAEHNFETEEESNSPYDYYSIMHYGATTFGKPNGSGGKLKTIECLNNGRTVPCPDSMGQRSSISALDISGIAAFYSRTSTFPCGRTWKSPICPNFVVSGDISIKYAALGGSRSMLGCPVTNETGTPDRQGRFNHFQGGSIYWTQKTGAHEIRGEIGGKWAKVGRENAIGYPMTDEISTPDGKGRYNHFRKYNANGGLIGEASIYWYPNNPNEKAFIVTGGIRDKWAKIGWENAIGYPITDETNTPDGKGKFNHFKKYNANGSPIGDASIYYHPNNPDDKSFVISGSIRGKWALVGWENSIGYPITDEISTPDGKGRYNHFRKYDANGNSLGDASIYWHPNNPNEKAFIIHGAIRDKWASVGWERSPLGYPITDERDAPGGKIIYFTNGAIYWSSAGGAVIQMGKKP